MDIEYHVPYRFPDPNIGLGALGSPTTVGNPRLFAGTYPGFSHGGATLMSKTSCELQSKCMDIEYYVPFRFPDPNIGLGALGSPTSACCVPNVHSLADTLDDFRSSSFLPMTDACGVPMFAEEANIAIARHKAFLATPLWPSVVIQTILSTSDYRFTVNV